MTKQKINQWLLVTAGILALSLGVTGIFVPILPTTPFLLLAAGCFMRSSSRLYTWLIHHKWFGTYIRNYREYRAVTLQAKVVSVVLLWAVISISAMYAVSSWWVRALLVLVATGVTIHLLKMKTVTPEMIQSRQFVLKGGDD